MELADPKAPTDGMTPEYRLLVKKALFRLAENPVSIPR
jgi:hypothetical protein